MQGVKLQDRNPGENDGFGIAHSISADGQNLAIAATGESSNASGFNPPPEGQKDNSLANSGAVYLF